MRALGEILLDLSGLEERAEEALYGGKGAASVVIGPSTSAKALFLLALWRFVRTIVVLTAHQGEAERLVGDIAALLFGEKAPDPFNSPVCLYLPDDPFLGPDSTADPQAVHGRLYALFRLLRGEPTLVVAPAAALLTPTIPPGTLSEAVLEVRRGDWMAREELVGRLLKLGYERADLVEAAGQFAVRGGVVDVFPSNSLHPVRIELFGDEVESVREFDPESQRSVRDLKGATILPAREAVFEREKFERAAEGLEREAREAAERLRAEGRGGAASRLLEWALEDAQALRSASPFPTLERYKRYILGRPATLADYLPDTALLALDEPVGLKAHLEEFEREAAELAKRALERGEALPSMMSPPERAWERVVEFVKGRRHLLLASIAEDLPELPAERRVEGGAKSPRGFGGTLEGAIREMEGLAKRERHCVVCVTQAAERLKGTLVERGNVPVTEEVGPHHGAIWTVKGTLSGGFSVPEARLTVVTDAELFGARKVKRMRARRRVGIPIESLADLKPGDYVVHVHHGIGIYRGLRRQVVDGAEREYLLIQYAGEDKLYVPVHELHRVQKYVALDDEPPPLSSLGGKVWPTTTAKAKRAAEELARDLLELYAKRAKAEGFAFSPDQPWQLELEASFPYEETEDQLRAIEEVKRDMEKPKPMDRLVCGDVGFGKTEVAVRAAFKAVLDGKQVAVLVPTTVLAEQHYRTFRERMAPFPVRVEMLSRFASPRKQREILEGLRAGTVDVVIGTHRLLSEDVRFKDLGLVIIDEEHRFGVRQKERLKRMKPEVDVLTLTATPIPRTLHMALSGIVDMSVINQPPSGRKPVNVRICRYDPELVREAILRELERGGQVFYVHNRIETIEFAAQRVRELVPKARVEVAHGQMPEERLERVMCDFVDGKVEVLVCTSIIGSGLDIPNANTLIVERADKDFGLAQLYHLKGRVGRSDRQAYAYFLISGRGKLTPGAQLRLAALREFTELGSGLKLAMRDLEIRGAGNLLGPEQHGHIRAVGLTLYMQLLEEAVKEAKGEEARPRRPQPTVDIAIDARIPEDYIEEEGVRIEVYRRLAACETEGELERMREELRDRFGPIPGEVENLLKVARLRIRASLCGVASVRAAGGRIVVSLSRVLPRAQAEAAVDRARKMGRPAALLDFEPSPAQIIARLPGGFDKEDILPAVEQIVEAIFAVAGPLEEAAA